MKMMNRLFVVCLALAAGPLCASTVNVSLGQSAQNYVATGLGPDASNDGQWFMTQGACAFNGTNTVCDLTGNYTGATAGFTAGTYDFQTVYPGSGFSPLLAVSTQPFGNTFTFSFVDPTLTMNLFLHDVGGLSYNVPIFQGNTFVGGYFVSFTSSNCTGTPISPCSFAGSGQTLGSIFSSPVTGGATFDTADVTTVTPEPSSLVLAGSGVLALFGAARRRFGRRS
jgi:hypothetical protein